MKTGLGVLLVIGWQPCQGALGYHWDLEEKEDYGWRKLRWCGQQCLSE